MKTTSHLRRIITLHRELANAYQQWEEEMSNTEGPALQMGKAGRITNLREQIKTALRAEPGLTSAQLSDTLYSDKLGIDRGTFLRRINVTVSSLHTKDKVLDMKPTGNGKEVKWYLKENQDE